MSIKDDVGIPEKKDVNMPQNKDVNILPTLYNQISDKILSVYVNISSKYFSKKSWINPTVKDRLLKMIEDVGILIKTKMSIYPKLKITTFYQKMTIKFLIKYIQSLILQRIIKTMLTYQHVLIPCNNEIINTNKPNYNPSKIYDFPDVIRRKIILKIHARNEKNSYNVTLYKMK